MTPFRLAFVFQCLVTGIRCRVASEAEWLAWRQREDVSEQEFNEVRGMTLAQIDAALAPLRETR